MLPGPSALVPGVVKSREPEFANGEPVMVTKLPLAGSYQRAVVEPAMALMVTVIVRLDGTYAMRERAVSRLRGGHVVLLPDRAVVGGDDDVGF